MKNKTDLPTAVCSNWGFSHNFKVGFVFGRLVLNL